MIQTFVYFFFYCYAYHRDLHLLTHSFPTRLSSDLDPDRARLWRRGPQGAGSAPAMADRAAAGRGGGGGYPTAVQPAGHSPSARAVPRRRPAQRRTGTAVRRGEGGAARRGHLSPPGAIERRPICAHREETGV